MAQWESFIMQTSSGDRFVFVFYLRERHDEVFVFQWESDAAINCNSPDDVVVVITFLVFF